MSDHEDRRSGFRPIGWWLKEADGRLEAAFDELTAEGWLTDDDGTLRLTADGEELQAKLAAGIAEIRGWVAEALPGEDYRTLVDLLRRLVDAFPPAPDPAG